MRATRQRSDPRPRPPCPTACWSTPLPLPKGSFVASPTQACGHRARRAARLLPAGCRNRAGGAGVASRTRDGDSPSDGLAARLEPVPALPQHAPRRRKLAHGEHRSRHVEHSTKATPSSSRCRCGRRNGNRRGTVWRRSRTPARAPSNAVLVAAPTGHATPAATCVFTEQIARVSAAATFQVQNERWLHQARRSTSATASGSRTTMWSRQSPAQARLRTWRNAHQRIMWREASTLLVHDLALASRATHSLRYPP